MAGKSGAPSAKLAKQRLQARKQKGVLKSAAQSVEEKHRKAGGYGKSVVSIYDVPKGGIMNSPAYRKMLTRVELDKNGKPPAPEKRDGAPLSGGYPIKDYPPNVIVDGQRASWLPDDWAQVIKNTGPGGVYFGWMSPQGKFFYHRGGYPSAIEETLGRKLSVKDGMNTMIRNIRNIVKPGADKTFLHECLTAAERKHIAPAKQFYFAVVSARRATSESGQYDIMVIDTLFKQAGIKAVWYVDEASLEDYKKLGLTAKIGGKLTPARNMALDDAKKKKLVCVQVSDDISKWIYYDCAKQDFRGEKDFSKANAALLGSKKHVVSPLAAAQFILAKMRADPGTPKLGGVFPTANAAMTLGGEMFAKEHFILGDFFVAEPSSPCRFDTNMTLKEDYDYTCSHLKEHGCVMRCQRMFLQVKHATNEGGAVASRDTAGLKEKQNIAILQSKWPGVFSINGRRKNVVAGSEVVMSWKRYGCAKPEPKRATLSSKLVKGLRTKVKNTKVQTKKKACLARFPENKVLRYTKSISKSDYINKRCIKLHQKKVGSVLGMKFKDDSGNERSYGFADLKYDIDAGRIVMA